MPQPHRRITAWLAIVAMLAFALVPTLSRALAFAGGSGQWAEVCTPQGVKLVSLATVATDTTDAGAAADDGSAPATALPLDHCAYCTLSGDGGATPLPSATPVLGLPLASAEPPALFLQAGHTLHAWCSAQPRAPPALS